MNKRVSHIKNAAIVAAGSYFESAIGLVVGVIVARSLGPDQFGAYAFAIWLMGWLITACSQSVTTVTIKFAAEALGRGDLVQASNIYGYLLRAQAYLSIGVLAVYALAFWLIHPPEWESTLFVYLAFSASAIWSKARFWMNGSICNSQERFEPENLALAYIAVLNLIAVAFWAWFSGSLIGYIGIFAATGCGALLLIRRQMAQRLKHFASNGPVPEELKRRIWSQIKATAALVVISLLGNRAIETLLLKATATSAVVGFFALAGTLTKGAVDLMTGGLNSVLLPAMSRKVGQSSKAGVGAMLSESSRYYNFLGLLVVGAGLTFAPGIVSLLYGAKYNAAIPAIVISLMIAGLTSVSAALYAYQTSTEKQADRVAVAIITIIGNLIFAIALIPRFGLNGALASLAATRVLNLFATWIYVRRSLSNPLPLGVMGRQTIAMLIGLVPELVLRQTVAGPYLFILSFALFLLIFMLCSVILRTWKPLDFDLCISILNKVGVHGGPLVKLINAARSRYGLIAS